LRFHLQRQVLCFALALIAPVVMSNCGDVQQQVRVSPPTVKGAAHVVRFDDVGRYRAARRVMVEGAYVTRFQEVVWLVAIAEGLAERSAQVAKSQIRTDRGVPAIRPPVATAGSLASIMDCIKRAESGNYAESSHPGSGSGAYQMIPSTFTTWSARAGYPGYAYAYQAPPAVQDAADPCTSGLPGGG